MTLKDEALVYFFSPISSKDFVDVDGLSNLGLVLARIYDFSIVFILFGVLESA
jgi:hypothetical protein